MLCPNLAPCQCCANIPRRLYRVPYATRPGTTLICSCCGCVNKYPEIIEARKEDR